MPRCPARGRCAPEAPEIMVRLLLAARRREGRDRVAARLERLGHALDRPALARRVPALEHGQHRHLLLVQSELQLAQPHLRSADPLAGTRLLAQLALGEVDASRASARLRLRSAARRLAPRRRAARRRSPRARCSRAAPAWRLRRQLGAADGGRRRLAPRRAPLPCARTSVSKTLTRVQRTSVASTTRPGRVRRVGLRQHLLDRLHPLVVLPVAAPVLLRRPSSARAGSRSIRRRRRFCSFCEMCSQNFTSTWPSSASQRSNSLICS